MSFQGCLGCDCAYLFIVDCAYLCDPNGALRATVERYSAYDSDHDAFIHLKSQNASREQEWKIENTLNPWKELQQWKH